MAELKTAFAEVQAVLHPEIKRIFSENLIQAGGDDPWSRRIIQWLEEYCLRPGKAIRPALVAIGAATVQHLSLSEAIKQPAVVRSMVIAELLHKRLILADDVVDRDEKRNDAPAFHKVVDSWLKTQPNYESLTPLNREHFSRSYTEVAGIFLQQLISHEMTLLSADISAESWKQATQDINRYGYQRTMAGWLTLLDQGLEPLSPKVSRARFLRGLEMVTSDYTFVFPLLLGTSVGPSDPDTRQTMIDFGRIGGLLFQLTDDVIGLFGKSETTGKPVGGDVREGKKTLLILEAYKNASPLNKQKLERYLGKSNITADELFWVKDLVEETGSLQASKRMIRQQEAKALQILETWPDPGMKHVLEAALSAIVERDH